MTFSRASTSMLLIVLLSLSFIQLSSCWGGLGHRTVGYLAQKYLTQEGASFAATLLDDGDLSDAAVWADAIKHHKGWTYTAEWHYIDAKDDPPRVCQVNYSRDCDAVKGCVVSEIVNQTARVQNTALSHTARQEALKFIFHFIGDIHQPLHTEAEDRGGNGIAVLWNSKHTNLHSIWDTDILIKLRGGAEKDEKAQAAAWANDLYSSATRRDLTAATECTNVLTAEKCALEWASEANAHVCDYVLKDDVQGVEGQDLSGDYYEGAVPIVNDMIGKAGVRLAAWVNALAAAGAAESEEL
jgi:hypothetical protein